MSEANGFNPTIHQSNKLPDIAIHTVLSELLTFAALFIEHRHKDPAMLMIKRIQQITQGKLPNCFKPDVFQERMEICLRAAKRL